MGLVGRKKLLVNLSESPSSELFHFISVCCSAVSVLPSAAEDKILFASPKTQTGSWQTEGCHGQWDGEFPLKICSSPSSVSYAEFPHWSFHKTITQHSCSFSTWWTSGTHFQPHFYTKFRITVLTSHLLWWDSSQQIKIFKATRGQSAKLSLNFTTYFFLKFLDSR